MGLLIQEGAMPGPRALQSPDHLSGRLPLPPLFLDTCLLLPLYQRPSPSPGLWHGHGPITGPCGFHPWGGCQCWTNHLWPKKARPRGSGPLLSEQALNRMVIWNPKTPLGPFRPGALVYPSRLAWPHLTSRHFLSWMCFYERRVEDTFPKSKSQEKYL